MAEVRNVSTRLAVIGCRGSLGSGIVAAAKMRPDVRVTHAFARDASGWEDLQNGERALPEIPFTDLEGQVVVDATAPMAAVGHAFDAAAAGVSVLIVATSTHCSEGYQKLRHAAQEANSVSVAVVPYLAAGFAFLEMATTAAAATGRSHLLVDHAQAGVPTPLDATRYLESKLRASGSQVEVVSIRDGTRLSRIELTSTGQGEDRHCSVEVDDPFVWANTAVDAAVRLSRHRGGEVLEGVTWMLDELADGKYSATRHAHA